MLCNYKVKFSRVFSTFYANIQLTHLFKLKISSLNFPWEINLLTNPTPYHVFFNSKCVQLLSPCKEKVTNSLLHQSCKKCWTFLVSKIRQGAVRFACRLWGGVQELDAPQHLKVEKGQKKQLTMYLWDVLKDVSLPEMNKPKIWSWFIWFN